MTAQTAGRMLAAARIRALGPMIERARQDRGRSPVLALIAAEDATSQRFVAIKRAAFEPLGLALRDLPTGAGGTRGVATMIAELNADAEVDGIFLQYPLPAGIDAQQCADAIELRKDIDAASTCALAHLITGDALFVPAAPAAVLELLEDGLGQLRGRTVLVVGGIGLMERVILLLCAARGALCAVVPPDAGLGEQLARADAVVLTSSLAPTAELHRLRPGAVLLDATYDQPPRRAGWLPDPVLHDLGVFHPQYGSVGPLTVALLMEATVRATLRRR